MKKLFIAAMLLASCTQKKKIESPYHYTISYSTYTDSVYCAEPYCGGYWIRKTDDYHKVFLPAGNYKVSYIGTVYK